MIFYLNNYRKKNLIIFFQKTLQIFLLKLQEFQFQHLKFFPLIIQQLFLYFAHNFHKFYQFLHLFL